MKTEVILSNFYKFIKGKMKIMSFVGIIGFPIYFFIWNNLFPQEYENLSLRISCAIIAIPWLFNHIISKKIEKAYSIYIFFSILFCLPFFFSFMWIKNDFSAIWTMSYIAQLYLLFLLFYSWALIYITSLIGFGIACGVKYFLDGEISFAEFQLEYIPIFFLLIFTSIIFHRHEAEHVEKEEVLTSFGASIAHEMRNSLSISIGSSRIIQRIMSFSIEKNQLKNEVSIDMNDVLEIQQTMELLENSSFRTSMVIDLILKNVHNQQIETDKFKNHYIFDIISTAINEFGYKEGEKEKIRVLHIENFLLKGDKDLAVFVLLNLFNNAFNNNTSDNCEIQIWTEKHIKHNSLHIKDNGPGIPKEKLNVIFDRFITLGNNGGAGLGLTFCKRVMNSFKGEIICESEIGNYTEFIIQFPISNKLHFEKTTENDLNIKDDSEKKEVLVPIN